VSALPPSENSERTIIQVVADCKTLRSALGVSFDPFHKWAEKSDVERVESIDLRFITSKSTKACKDKGRSSGGKLRSLNRSTVGEGRHIDVLALWVAICGSNSDIDENTPLFSFHAPSGATTSSRNIRSKEVKAELRQNAIQEGLDPNWFSTKSFRVTYSTAAALRGVPLQEVNAHGGWSVNSTVAARNYSRVMESRSTVALVRGERGGISLELVQKLGFGRIKNA